MKAKFFLLFFFASQCALAEVYKSVDASGHVTFTDRQTPGAVKVDIPPAPPRPKAPDEASAGEALPEDAPAEGSAAEGAPVAPADKFAQKRQEIEAKLAAENEKLKSAKAALAELQAKISGDSYPTQEDNDRVGALTDEVNAREKRVEEMRQQLSVFK